jgi:hypothetical protein
MPLTRLDNLISSKTGKYLYVSPDDFNATDALSNRGNSPITPFKSIQRAFLEVARYSYLPGKDNDRFDQFSIMLMPGIHYIDNRPGLVDTNGIDVFAFDQALNAWTDNSILDIANPNNILYKFNNTEGGAIIPRGSSLVGYDLRRTTIRPLYVPDPASVTVPRSAIFNVTGGCYFWQFTIKDGQTTSESPLYNSAEGTGEVYYDPTDFTKLTAPNYSHHKLTVFEYADQEELSLFYRKIGKAFSAYQPTIDDPGEFGFNIQENRIVGPLSDSRVIESLKFTDATTDPSIPASTTEVEVTTKVDHGYFSGQFVSISNTQIDDVLEGFFPIKEIDANDPRKFIYEVPIVVGAIGTNIVSGQTISVDTTPALGQNAQTLAEVDSVESASPYVFNVSIRSTWGICGIWANGLKATGFRSMVIAQYTGVSLQKDDRAFIRYDEYSNTWNQASLSDAFATVPYHAKGDSYWKDEWRNFHVRASEDAFIQNVSIFAVGFADHFLMETGGDMSITNSNSNFGNTSLHAIGFKGFSFNQDKAGYITDIIPPKKSLESAATTKKVAYYTVDIQGTIQNSNNYTKLFLGSDDIITPTERPAATIDGFRIGAKTGDKLYVKLGSLTPGGNEVFEAELQPTGFLKYIAKGSILNPSGFAINGITADAANMIESNRTMIQEEVFGYILEKYPALQNIPYVNPGLNPAAGRYFDARNLILANRQEIVDTAFQQMVDTYGIGNIQGVADGKCKRDIGFIVDAIAEDLRDGGNLNTIEATKFYFDGAGNPISNGLVGEETYSVFAFNRARDLCKKAIANLLTVKANIHDPDTNSVLNKPGNPYGYLFGTTGSSGGLNSAGVTVDDSNKQDPAGRYKDARNRVLANREFILDAALAEIGVYHPDFYIPGDTQSNAQSRFADAYRLIRRNSKEIADRALAKIAVDYPDFYFPGDAQTTTDSRFYDSYRLIQQNKTEIVNTAWTNMVTLYPGVASTETKCKRDLGYFVDAISLDLFIRGNEYSYRFAAEYFTNATTPLSNGLVGEVTESIYAFNQAKTLMKSAITNQLTVKDLTITADPATGSNTNANSCANVRSAIDTLTGIVTAIINDGNLNSLPLQINKGSAPAGMKKCARDIGYFIDAVAVDVFTGGNKHTRTFVQQYFNGNTPISNGLVGETAQSNTAFNEAAEYMRQAVVNALYYKDLTITPDPSPSSGAVGNQNTNNCANVRSAITTLAGIATAAITAGNLNSLPAENAGTFLTGEVKCRRDIGHIVDAVAQDLWFGGNEYTIAATKEYFTNATTLLTNGVAGETGPSITAFRRAQDLMNRAINNQYYVRDLTLTLDNTEDPAVFSDIHSNVFLSIMDNKKFIAKEAYQRMKLAYPSYAPQTGNTEQDCLDDVYDVLEQIAYDIKFGGNAKTYDAANVYVTNTFNGQPVQTFIDPERDEAAKVFLEAKKVAIAIINNVVVTPTAGNTETQVFDFTQTHDWDADENLPKCGSAIAAADTLFGIIIQAIGNDGGVGNLTGITRTAPAQPTTYAVGNCSDVLATVDTLISIVVDSLYAGNLNVLPPLSNGEWDCANVRSTIENLFDIVTDAIRGGTLAGLPLANAGDFIANAKQSKCYRDVSYIVDAVVNDLRLGGNVNSIQAGEAYYVGNNLTYIDGEKTETIDAWNYVGDLAIAAMRNFDVLAVNCVTNSGSAIVNVADTRGITIGMRVVEYANTPTPYVNGLLQNGAVPIYTNIPKDTFVKRIVSNTTIELGVANSRFTSGNTVNALQTSTTTKLYFTFEKGAWANTLPQRVTVGPANTNPDVIQDTTAFTPSAPTQRECASTANAIITLIGNITTIINSGLGTVALQEQTVNTALFASRATVFTIDTTGYGSTNAHNFETGTPVRLVPRPRFDITTGKYVEVDKRLVRLPKGFEPNRTYYVIAPGRRTQPADYSNTTYFNGSDQTKLMLATSKENAAAGIYIYASETSGIDADVEIDLYQFVLDDKYDLHNYRCNLTNTVNAGIETDVSHIFDRPSASTTPHRVFFRAVEGGQLPLVSQTYQSDPTVAVTNPQNANVGRINPQVEFFARYQNDKVFTIHKTHADAINNVNPIQFFAGQAGLKFDVYANKRRSPMRFDPSFTDAKTSAGKWYVQCKDVVTGGIPNDIAKNIFTRINEDDYSDRPRTTDMWYERLDDTREADDRTYKIRYVIPKYIENARDPINGFVLKTRTDDTRKLVPQKIVLKPVTGSVYGARFENPVQAGEYIGYTAAQFTSNDLNSDAAYDPFKKDLTNQGIDYRAFAKFSSGIQATIQSGRYVADALDANIKYLELTVYDHTVDSQNFPGLRNELFTTVKITSPQGGDFVANKTQNILANKVFFTGASSGSAYIHAYYSVGGDHYLIIKGIAGGKLEYSEYANVRFTQGTVFADMIEDQDMGKSLPLKTLIRKGYPEYYWRQNGANVYTITPGDKIQDDAGIEYYVDSVEDAGIIEDTFYIFATETLQRRIAGQQDGIYYLTCLRGNVSPFPTGAGVTNNFKNYKFSQPVGRLYPLNYRNDPLWFQKNGTTNEEKDYYAALIDPPETFSAADNYTHGLVTVNDYKNSVTRETVGDLIKQSAFADNTYSGTVVKYGKTLNAAIQAQEGNATSGSEDRIIPISGSSTVVTDQRYYVELRRPSIARAGNHTFEYLGFGPGNYSTGLPARQEVVLTPDQDFYAQAKKQDAGIVFYTGINSQGDLYIGNRRINAITGEETFIDKATLADDGDENDVIGGLVTTFDTPVTFNENFTVVGGDGTLVTNFESPVVISVQDNDLIQERDALIIRSNVSSVDPVTQLQQDEGLDRTSFRPVSKGDIKLSKNRIQSAIFAFNSRGNGQEYLIQTHSVVGVASNITPNQLPLVSNNGTALSASQFVTYGGVLPTTGDILLKGSEVGKAGSLGWILANYYQSIANNSIENVIFDGSNVVKVTFRSSVTGLTIACQDIGITSASQIRFKNYPDPNLNLTWVIYSPNGDAFSPTKPYVYFQILAQRPALVQSWASLITQATNSGNPLPTIEFSNANWKEVGVIGAEALRTETETIGNYKLGINTVARSPHSAHTNAFVDAGTTDPRANLDVVGNAYISGKKTTNYLQHTNFADRNKNAIADAFIVGGDSGSPTDYSALRVDTRTVAITEASRGNNLGRVGINTDETVTDKQLNRALVVVGDSRFTEDARFERDIEIYTDSGTDTAEVRTGITTGSFNLLNGSTTTQFTGQLSVTNGVLNKANSKGLRLGNNLAYIEIGDAYTDDQFIFIGNNVDHSNIFLGDISDASNRISKVQIGGAYGNNSSNSYVTFGTRRVNFAGDVVFGANKLQGGDRLNPEMTISVGTEAGIVQFFTGNTQTLDFATNASEINIGGQGGQTKVRNNLVVDAGARFNSNVTLCGGFASFSFVGNRAQLGSALSSHSSGILGQNTFNSNIDIVNVFVVSVVNQNAPTPAELTAGFNRIDTAGAGVWGGNSGVSNFQAAVPGAGPEGATLPALTGLEYYIPMKYKPTPYFQAGDYIIIDTAISGSGGSATHPEIVRVTEDGLQGAETAPYYLKVRRQPLGTFTTIKTNHPDTTNVWKVNVAFDATWITQGIDASGSQDNVYLSEFGGQLTTNDYVIIDRTDSNSDGIADQGEVFKVASLLEQVAKKFSIKNGCDTQAVETVFEVDSTTGSVSLGDPGNTNTSTFIYGNLTVTGQCGGAGTADNTKLTFKNELYTTAEIDICTGNAFFGSNYATVFAIGAIAGTTAASHSTTTPVYVYTRDPFSIQANGPLTTIFATQQTGSVVAATSNIPVASISGFQKGDLVAIFEGTTLTTSKLEIIRVTDDPFTNSTGSFLPTSSNAIYLTGGRGQETTTAKSWNTGAVLVKIRKDTRSTTLAEAVPATGRVQVEAPNNNPNKIRLRLVNGDLVAEKLDYEQLIRIDNEFFYPDSKNGQNDPVFGVRLPKSYRDPDTTVIERFFGGGNLTSHGDLTITSGNLRMFGSDGKTLIFNVANDDGHPGDGGILDEETGKNGMYLNGFANIYGNLQVYNQQCQENGTCSNDLVFQVERSSGSVDMGESLYIKGRVFEQQSASTQILHIDNLGSAGNSATGPKDFIMYQDGSIDAFGITQYFTANGGRRWTYVAASATGIGQTVGNPLQPNNNYLLNLSTGGNMVLYLPTTAVTGDIIRFVELSGNLSYNTNLVIRALPVNNVAVAIQGDSTGTRLVAGTGSSLLPTAYNGGELIIQTRNAGFGLLYVGSTDAPNDPNASEIPSNLRGWWLVEL